MSNNIERLLNLTADMESFIHSNDALGKLVDSIADDELSEFELSFVSAATATPSYASFLREAEARKKNAKKL